MKKGCYIGISGDAARKTKEMYAGVGDIARKVKKGYIGVDDTARLFYENEAAELLFPPDAPTNVRAAAGNGRATVTFAAPANDGGSAIIRYTVVSTPDNISVIGAQSPIVVTGLRNGVSYTFRVFATNAVGDGPLSAASNAVTPAAPSGREERTASGNFIVPEGVTSLRVTLVGGGGGGANSGLRTSPTVHHGGGGGGSGGFNHFTLGVTPGEVFNFTVGSRGGGGLSMGANGTNGTATTFGNSRTGNRSANGGEGGFSGRHQLRPGQGGAGGAPGGAAGRMSQPGLQNSRGGAGGDSQHDRFGGGGGGGSLGQPGGLGGRGGGSNGAQGAVTGSGNGGAGNGGCVIIEW